MTNQHRIKPTESDMEFVTFVHKIVNDPTWDSRFNARLILFSLGAIQNFKELGARFESGYESKSEYESDFGSLSDTVSSFLEYIWDDENWDTPEEFEDLDDSYVQQLEKQVSYLTETLEKLSTLGGGNSLGNEIADQALKHIRGN